MSRDDLKLALVGMGFTTPRVSCFLKASGADGNTPAWFLASSQKASGGAK